MEHNARSTEDIRSSHFGGMVGAAGYSRVHRNKVPPFANLNLVIVHKRTNAIVQGTTWEPGALTVFVYDQQKMEQVIMQWICNQVKTSSEAEKLH